MIDISLQGFPPHFLVNFFKGLSQLRNCSVFILEDILEIIPGFGNLKPREIEYSAHIALVAEEGIDLRSPLDVHL